VSLLAKWIAVSRLPKAEIFRSLRLVDPGRSTAFQLASPAYLDLEDDWLAVVGRFPPPETMEALSEGGWALACIVDQVSRFSLAQGYQYGQPCWSVIYEEGHVPDLEALGSPPESFTTVVDEMMEEAANARRAGRASDAPFRIPIELAGRECGFWPDASRMGAPTMAQLEERRPIGSFRRRLAAAAGLFGR